MCSRKARRWDLRILLLPQKGHVKSAVLLGFSIETLLDEVAFDAPSSFAYLIAWVSDRWLDYSLIDAV